MQLDFVSYLKKLSNLERKTLRKIEQKMVDILRKGREEFGVIATKAEFEAEGTRTDELLRLIDIANKANVEIALKIGGCEAIRDLLEAKQFGVKYIIAPMVETPYALSKYISAKEKVFDAEEKNNMSFLFNVETETTFKNIDSIITMASGSPGCNGLVYGRVDYSGSLGKGRNIIESKEVTDVGIELAEYCKRKNLEFVVGGAVSMDALPNLRRINEVHLDRFETRKIVFQSQALNEKSLDKYLVEAVHFELLWLINKREYYGLMHKEDEARIEMLENRWNVLKDK